MVSASNSAATLVKAFLLLVGGLVVWCGPGPLGLQLVPSGHGLILASRSTLEGNTQVTTFLLRTPVDPTRLSGYPLDLLPDNNWSQRLWDDAATPGELRSLIDWLKEQRDSWSWRPGEHLGEIRRIDDIMTDLASWLDSSTSHRSRIAYSYSSGIRPGLAKFRADWEWLNFYYLHPDGTTLTEITNSFR